MLPLVDPPTPTHFPRVSRVQEFRVTSLLTNEARERQLRPDRLPCPPSTSIAHLRLGKPRFPTIYTSPTTVGKVYFPSQGLEGGGRQRWARQVNACSRTAPKVRSKESQEGPLESCLALPPTPMSPLELMLAIQRQRH